MVGMPVLEDEKEEAGERVMELEELVEQRVTEEVGSMISLDFGNETSRNEGIKKED